MRVSQPSVTTLLALALLMAPAAASAQTDDVPRTPWGVPDLGGVWDFRTLTPLERPERYGDREFLTREEALVLERGAVEQSEAADRAPAQRTEAGGSIGAYNRFWMDFGTTVVGSRRTSLIVDPPNGRRGPTRAAPGTARPGRSGRRRWSRSRTSATSTAAWGRPDCPSIPPPTTTTCRSSRPRITW